jgi:hypothetical protein
MIIFVSVFCFGIYVFNNAESSNRKILSKLTGYFNGSVSSTPLYTIFKGQYQGLDFSIKLYLGGENAPPYLIISLVKDCTLHLAISRENTLSHVGEKIGLVHKVKVDDETFNSLFLIFSNYPDRARVYFSSADKKNSIRDIFYDGFDSLKADKKNITIRKPNYNIYDIEPQKITGVLQRLSLMMQGL